MDCIFCKIANGEIPSTKVYEDDTVVAFNDLEPQAPTHILVIPKKHITSAADINEENSGVIAHIFEVIAKIAKEQGAKRAMPLALSVPVHCRAQAGIEQHRRNAEFQHKLLNAANLFRCQ
mgnify:CR=1 FL=1